MITKFDVNVIKLISAEASREMNKGEEALIMDLLKIIQSILSKRLPPAIGNGMVNLMYVVAYPNATTEHIENAVVKYQSK